MLLQTVVENAIKHGIADLPAGGVLRIHGGLHDGALMLEVENPRPVAPSSERLRKGSGCATPQSDCACCLAIVPASTSTCLSRRVATIRIRIPRRRMKAMIVDDEPPARRELRRMLAEFPWIEIVGEAGNVDEAAEQGRGAVP